MTEKQYERYYDQIMNDASLTDQERHDAIADLDRDYRESMMEQDHREQEEREMEQRFGKHY